MQHILAEKYNFLGIKFDPVAKQMHVVKTIRFPSNYRAQNAQLMNMSHAIIF